MLAQCNTKAVVVISAATMTVPRVLRAPCSPVLVASHSRVSSVLVQLGTITGAVVWVRAKHHLCWCGTVSQPLLRLQRREPPPACPPRCCGCPPYTRTCCPSARGTPPLATSGHLQPEALVRDGSRRNGWVSTGIVCIRREHAREAMLRVPCVLRPRPIISIVQGADSLTCPHICAANDKPVTPSRSGPCCEPLRKRLLAQGSALLAPLPSSLHYFASLHAITPR